MFQSDIQTDRRDEAKLLAVLRKRLIHLSVDPLHLELYRGFTTEELGEQNKDEENKSPDIDEKPSEKCK